MVLFDDRKPCDIPAVERQEFHVMCMCSEIKDQIEKIRECAYRVRLGKSTSDELIAMRSNLCKQLRWVAEDADKLNELYHWEGIKE